MTTSIAPEKSEVEVLFPDEKIGEYTIRPWTLKQVIALTPLLGSILTVLKERGVDVGKFADSDTKFEDLEITAETVITYVQDLAPFVPKINAVTVNTDEASAENMEWGLGVAIFVKTLVQNWTHIKNYLSLLRIGESPRQAMIPTSH